MRRYGRFILVFSELCIISPQLPSELLIGNGHIYKQLSVYMVVIVLADYNFSESLSTLQFANRAKNIKNTTRRNEVRFDIIGHPFLDPQTAQSYGVCPMPGNKLG